MMSQTSTDSWINRDSEARAIRLTTDTLSLECAEDIYEIMKQDRPHMAARLSKLMPKMADDDRTWSSDVLKDHVHIWALKVAQGSMSKYVAIIWFELVGNGGAPGNKKDLLSSSSKNPTTAHIEVLWTHPQHRQFGFGSRLVQQVLVRYPNISKWTAFTSRDMKKDAGVNRFWIKNGFYQDTIEVGKVNQDGFFIRNAAVETAKRRRVQTQIFEIKNDDRPLGRKVSTSSRNG
jgi:ribosomal protein S18 acetylase RimI-like enzyme